MSADWPVTLPQAFKVGSYVPGIADNKLSTPMDQGPAKSRRRAVIPSRIDRGSIDVTATEWATLRAFYETTLKSGTLQFTMFDPLGGADREVRFASPPEASQNGLRFVVSLQIEVLP